MASPWVRLVLSLLLSIALGGGVMLSCGGHGRASDLVAKASSASEIDVDDIGDDCLDVAVLPPVEDVSTAQDQCFCLDLKCYQEEILLLDEHAPRGPPA